MTWYYLVGALVLGFAIAREELRDECTAHGKNAGKAMQWNVFGGCEETRR